MFAVPGIDPALPAARWRNRKLSSACVVQRMFSASNDSAPWRALCETTTGHLLCHGYRGDEDLEVRC